MGRGIRLGGRLGSVPEGQWPHSVILGGFPNTGHSLTDGARAAGNGGAREPRPAVGVVWAGAESRRASRRALGATPLWGRGLRA